jgi:hypothetical protein
VEVAASSNRVEKMTIFKMIIDIEEKIQERG